MNESDSDAPDPWMAAMRCGDFAAAWRISDAILEKRKKSDVSCTHWPRHLQYIWSGESLKNKRVLVRCYHGLGDTIQFVRFVAPLREIAREVILWAQPALVPLLRTAPGVDRCLPLHDGTPDVDHDADIELMELPHALRITSQQLVTQIPYLHPNASVSAISEMQLRVGIAWQAGDWSPQRSFPIDALRPLCSVPGLRLFSLQYGGGHIAKEILHATDFACRSIDQLAARMQSLDLVISVDTMVAHLAGALGLPVWTLLNAECDWRWMDGRSDTPWYPSMRLFRQPRADEWSNALVALMQALRELLSRSG